MVIGFDISQTGKSKAGCGYFADALIRQLASDDNENTYVLYPAVGDQFWDPECASSTFSTNKSNFSRLKAPSDFDESRVFWQNPRANFERKLGNPDIFHSNNFYCPSALNHARLVYTLYDLSFLSEPDWTTEGNRIGCVRGVFQASLQADSIVAISNYSRHHFLSTFKHFPPERVSVIHPASRFRADLSIERPQRFHALRKQEFWLSVGTIEPRKNQRRLLEAYQILKSRNRTLPPLVLAGGNGWLMDDFGSFIQTLGLVDDVILTGYVSDIEMQWLLQNCFGLIYPSLFEGFGMPVLEALGLGSPVLCSNVTSLPEVAGKAALYFEPTDAANIAAEMSRLASGEVSRDSLISAGYEQAKRFSWAHSAAQLRELYQDVMGRPQLWKPTSAHAAAE
jgi:glycosyltransferase involved in cell wall biosynthesis